MKYIIFDQTSNTGKDYVGEDGNNVSEESEAKRFDSYEEAETFAIACNPKPNWKSDWYAIFETEN